MRKVEQGREQRGQDEGLYKGKIASIAALLTTKEN